MSIHHVERAALTDLPATTKLVLMAICDSADKETRIAAPGMEALHQWSGLASKSRVLEIIAELVDAGYLTRVAAGRKGRRAEFRVFDRIACCPLHSGSGEPDPDPAPAQGPAQRTQTPKGSDKGSDKGSGPDRTPSVSPRGSVPKGTARDDSDGRHVNGRTCETGTQEGGEATVTATTAQTLVGEWLDHCPQRPPSRVIGQTSRELRVLLDDGIDVRVIRSGLAAWARRGLHPSALASVVHGQQQTPAHQGGHYDRSGPARVMTGSEWKQEARRG